MRCCSRPHFCNQRSPLPWRLASDPALDAARVLLETVVEVGAGAMVNRPAQHGADRHRVEAMAVHRHPVRSEARGVALAERKNAFLARMSRCSLSIASIRFPSRSIAQYKQVQRPRIFGQVSSTCQVTPDPCREPCRRLRSSSPMTSSSFAPSRERPRSSPRSHAVPGSCSGRAALAGSGSRREPRAVTSCRSVTAADPQHTQFIPMSHPLRRLTTLRQPPGAARSLT